MAANAVRENEIEALGPWFHNLHLPSGEQTCPGHFLGDFPRYKWEMLARVLPEDLSGQRVLDIGCNAGFYSIELAKRGAEVTAIDHDPHYLRQAAWTRAQFGLEDRIALHKLQVYDLAHAEQQFDLVLFLGVFYHLRYPLLGLDIVCRRVRGALLFQSLTMPGKEVFQPEYDYDIKQRDVLLHPGWPRMAFIENRFSKDPTNWWAPNIAAVEAMLRSNGMEVVERIERETLLCRPNPSLKGEMDPDTTGELAAATGAAAGARALTEATLFQE